MVDICGSYWLSKIWDGKRTAKEWIPNDTNATRQFLSRSCEDRPMTQRGSTIQWSRTSTFFFGRSSTNNKLFENADFDWVRGQYSCLPDPIPSNPPPQVKWNQLLGRHVWSEQFLFQELQSDLTRSPKYHICTKIWCVLGLNLGKCAFSFAI